MRVLHGTCMYGVEFWGQFGLDFPIHGFWLRFSPLSFPLNYRLCTQVEHLDEQSSLFGSLVAKFVQPAPQQHQQDN